MKKTNVRTLVNELDKKSGKLAAIETMLYTLLAAVTILFLFLAGYFLQSGSVPNFTVPPALSLSSVCIIISSVLVIKLKRLKNEDKLQSFKRVITFITVLGLIFFICQFLGWQELLHYFPSMQKNLIVLLVVAHAVHFAVAFALAFFITIKTYRISDNAEFYIWFLNVKQQQLFKLSFIYWDFLGYLWIILFVILQLKTML